MAELMLSMVSRSYGSATVVDGLSLCIPQGAFVALLGPSGCGKTTTLRMVAGFENPDAGEIRLGNRVLAGSQGCVPPEQRGMGMVFQSYALWPHLTVAENVGYPLKLRGVRGAAYEARVREALELVHLDGRAQAAPQDLSGGQRQRVALARCLVAEPEVILLDEPLANLDRHLRASMEDTFREFHRRTGSTFVYVTHDQAEAMSLADYVAVMNRGQLVQWATPQELYARPRSEWLAGFVGQGSVLRVPRSEAGRVLAGTDLAQALAAGGAYPVLLRPQHVRLHQRPAQWGELAGQVEDCVFRGERYEVQLVLAGGQRLLAYHEAGLAVGDVVAAELRQAWGLEQG